MRKTFKITFMLKVLAIWSIISSRRFELTATSKSGNNSTTRFDYEEVRNAYIKPNTEKNAEL